MASNLQEHKGTAGENPWYARWTGLIDEVQTDLNLRLEKIGGTLSGELYIDSDNDVVGYYVRDSGSVQRAGLVDTTSGQYTDYRRLSSGTILSSVRLFDSSIQIRVGGVAIITVTASGITQPTEIQPTLLNGWVNAAAGQEVFYYKDTQGRVQVRGRIKDGTMGAAAFTFPAGSRPSTQRSFPVDSNGAFGRVFINSDGQLIPNVGTNTLIVLDPISFRVA